MKTSDYLPSDDPGKLLWLDNFVNKLIFYAAVLGITPAQITQAQTDLDFFAAILTYLNNQKNALESVTGFKNQLRNGKLPLGLVPGFDVPPVVPAGALNDIFGRARLTVRTLKGNPALTPGMAEAFRIVGEEGEDNPDDWKPILKVEMKADSPNIKWKKAKSNGIKLWVDRGDGQGFQFLAIDTIPDYLDTFELPIGQTAIWKYRARYILNDVDAGQLSDIVEVTVTGTL